jgi:cytochrome d ubiquinol oxidase subunit II
MAGGTTAAEWTAGVMFFSLVLYAILGGADYGGGVWDLLASGPRAKEQRRLIEQAISPVWEANHVWLIFVIVILFTAFPPAFAALSVALHIPLTLMLLGIVMRGTAFTFRHYDRQSGDVQRRWSRIFGAASVITPITLGICIGAVATGEIRVENNVVTSGFLRPWLGLYPFMVGFFALALFAFLAAVFLTVETNDRALQDDFRKRALVTAVVVGMLALAVFLLSHRDAPGVHAGLVGRPWSLSLQLVTAVNAVGAIAALWKRRFRLARIFAAAQVALILVGWVLTHFPYLVPPDISIGSAAAADNVLTAVLWSSAVGALILAPSLYILFRIFKFSKQGPAV